MDAITLIKQAHASVPFLTFWLYCPNISLICITNPHSKKSDTLFLYKIMDKTSAVDRGRTIFLQCRNMLCRTIPFI